MKISEVTQATESTLADMVLTARDVLHRRWLTLLIVAGVVFLLGVVLVLRIPPMYASTAVVKLDPTRSALTANDANLANAMALTPEAIETEVRAIRSADVARNIVKTLHLDQDPEFTKGISGPAGMVPTTDQLQGAVAAKLLKQLDVARDKLTYMLNIRFSSRNPETAARVANAFADAYVYSKVGARVDNAEGKSKLLKGQLEQLGGEIRTTEEQVAQYRASAGISQSGPAGSSTTITDQQIGPISQQLASAESDAAAANAQLAAARGQAARGGMDSVSEVLNSPVVTNLRSQRAEVLRNMAEVQTRYGDRHPETIRVRDQLKQIDEQIAAEQHRVISALASNAAAANARAQSLRSAMSGLASHQADNTRKAVLADTLEREAQAKRAQYDRLSQNVLDSVQAAANTISQADVAERAKPATEPSSPNKPLFFSLALLAALAAGAGTIAVQELLATGMRTISDVEDGLGLPMLAAIPVVNSVHPADLLLERPTSAFAEALRLARAAILGVKREAVPKVIAVTSPLPSEGKTTTALAFARTLAINGAKTLLLECDVRRAIMQHSVGSPSQGPGLVEVLHGDAQLADAIAPGDVPLLDQMLVKAPYFSSEDLFGDGRMEQLLNTLREHYTHIVLDLPPLVGLADGRVIAPLADTVALVLRWDSTPLTAAQAAVGALKDQNANVSGAIYTMVEKSSEVVGALYYSKKYYNYYQAA